MSEQKRWVIYTDNDVSGFSLVPAHADREYDFSDPTSYPIALALPIVFESAAEAGRCVEWLERLVGRLTMAGKIAPTTVNNYYPQPDANAIAEQVRIALHRVQEGPRRAQYDAAADEADRLAQTQERVIRAQAGGVFRSDPNEPTEIRI